MSLRDLIAEDLDVCSKPCMLPRLLLSRPVQGPILIRQHSLLLRRLGQAKYEEIDDEENVFDDPTTVFVNGRTFVTDRWSEIA